MLLLIVKLNLKFLYTSLDCDFKLNVFIIFFVVWFIVLIIN